MSKFLIPHSLDHKKPTVLIVGAGDLQKATFHAAKQLGLQTIVTDRSKHAPSVHLADAFVELDTMDVKGHTRLAKHLKQAIHLAGVFTQGTDVEVTVAEAAHAASLPGVSPRAAHICKNKVMFRTCLTDSGIPQPRFREIATEKHAQSFIRQHGLPVIIKPIDNSASRGVKKIETNDDLKTIGQAIQDACNDSSTKTAMIEECLHGEEQSVETFVYKHRQYRLNVVDRPFGFDPYKIELGHNNPSLLDENIQIQLFELVEWATEVIGIDFGASKADTMLSHEYGPMILEMTARLSGGYHCQATSHAAYGTDEILGALEVAIGKPLDEKKFTKKWHKSSICRALFPTPGIIVSLDGYETAKEIPGVYDIIFLKKIGDVISSYKSGADRPCYVITVGETYKEAMETFKLVEKTFIIKTKPIY